MDIVNTLNFSFGDFISSTEGILMIVGIVLLVVGSKVQRNFDGSVVVKNVKR